MKAQIQLLTEDSTEIINVEDIDDPNHFSYIDSYNANNDLRIYEDGISLNRESVTHNTELVLRKDKSYILIKSLEGNLFFDAKILAFERNNDIITLVYIINSERKIIIIKFTGVSLCQQNQ